MKHQITNYMKKALIAISLVSLGTLSAQGPEITSWLQNTSLTGSYYTSGNSTPINNGIIYNCQQVEYSTNYVYVTTSGVPSYPTGPFLDGNPSQAQDQSAIYKFPLFPTEELGTKTETTAGVIGVFINGVALYDYRDGVSWNTATSALCGGPGNPPCPGGIGAVMPWNRDAVPAEAGGFDCSKGHPAMGQYHHHQNPSAFDLDLVVLETICNTYDADGLYAIDSTQHSPLLGYAYDGFPIYGAYGYANNNGTGGITRIKSGYQLRSISTRTHWADGTDVDDGPAVDATYFLGYFREDYEHVPQVSDDYLDIHNGRFCVTPEYPAGTYAYFCTVDQNWNSAYPYAIGPTFYGEYANRSISTISESTTVYTGANDITQVDLDAMNVSITPNPSSDLVAIQISGVNEHELKVELMDISGKLIQTTQIHQGQTIAYFDVQTLYSGTYLIRLSSNNAYIVKKVVVSR